MMKTFAIVIYSRTDCETEQEARQRAWNIIPAQLEAHDIQVKDIEVEEV